MKKTLLISIVCLMALISKAQPYGSAGQITKVVVGTDETPYGYVEYLPTGYNGTTKFPLIISFVGVGERGNGSDADLNRISSKPPINVIKSKAPNKAIVIAPQSGTAFFTSEQIKLVYDWAVTNYAVDLSRVYIMGFSAGGGNTWIFAADYPELVAAIVPICGAAKVPTNAAYLQTIPCWSHHNFDDNAVSKEFTSDNFRRISGSADLKPLYNPPVGIYPYVGGNPKVPASDTYTMYMNLTVVLNDTLVTMSGEYGVNEPKQFHAFTLYPSGGHNAWDKTLQNDKVWTWLFKQSKESPVITSTQKLEDAIIEIYPNPCTSKIEVQIPAGIVNNVTSISLRNMDGVILKSITTNISSNVTFNVSEFTSGSYTITINTSSDSTTRKVIIE